MKRFPILILSSMFAISAASGCRSDSPEVTKSSEADAGSDTADAGSGTNDAGQTTNTSCPGSDGDSVCEVNNPKSDSYAAAEAEVDLKNLVVTTNSFTVSGTLKGFYVADQDTDKGRYSGIIVVYREDQSSYTPALGDVVDLTGTMGEFYGQRQLSPTAVNKTGSASPSVTSVTEAEIATGTDGAKAYEGALIRVTEVEAGTDYQGKGESGEFWYQFKLNSEVYVVQKIARDILTAVKKGDKFSSITGILRLGTYNADKGYSEIAPRSADDIVTNGAGPTDPPETEVATTVKEASATTCDFSTRNDDSCTQVSLSDMVVTAVRGSQVWVQDPSIDTGLYAGVRIYKSEPGVAVGDVVNVTGRAYRYYGSLQIGTNVVITESSASLSVSPVVVPTSAIGPDLIEDNPYENTLVTIESVQVTNACVLTVKNNGSEDLGGFEASQSDNPVQVGDLFDHGYAGEDLSTAASSCDGRNGDQRNQGDSFSGITGIPIVTWNKLELEPRGAEDLQGLQVGE